MREFLVAVMSLRLSSMTVIIRVPFGGKFRIDFFGGEKPISVRFLSQEGRSEVTRNSKRRRIIVSA